MPGQGATGVFNALSTKTVSESRKFTGRVG